MQNEGFTPEHIKQLTEDVDKLEKEKINFCISRWHNCRDPKKRLLIKAFDHFRLAIKFRKVLRYWLNFSNNRVKHVQADI